MYKYGTSYFTVSGTEKLPVTGLDVRLVEPGGDYALGVVLPEVGETGYYAGDVAVPGYYELWDDNGGTPQFSGRTVVLGPANSAGISNGAVTSDKLAEVAVKSEKIAPGSIDTQHIGTVLFGLNQLDHEIATENDGIGVTSANTPAEVGVDELIEHHLTGEYQTIPFIVVVTHCDAFLWVDRVTLDGASVTVTLGVPIDAKAAEFKYNILAVATDLQE